MQAARCEVMARTYAKLESVMVAQTYAELGELGSAGTYAGWVQSGGRNYAEFMKLVVVGLIRMTCAKNL